MKSTPVIICFILGACSNSPSKSSPGHEHEHSAAGQTSGVAPHDDAAPRLRFARSLASAEDGEFVSSFQLLAQRDIVTRIELPVDSIGNEPVFLHFKVLNPEGVTHMSKWYALSADANTDALIRHPLLESDMPVTQLQRRGELAYFHGKIPVAGTNFTRYRLEGAFTARVTLGVEANQAPLLSHVFVMEL